MKKLRTAFLDGLKQVFEEKPDALDALAVADSERMRQFLALPDTHSIFSGSLFQAAVQREPMLLVRLVELGWPVDSAMTKLHGCLSMAVECGSLEAVEGLLALGANPNLLVNDVCPLYYCGAAGANTDEEMMAQRQNAARIAKALCEHGADPDGGNGMAKPMAALAARGAIEAAMVLVTWGASHQVGNTTVVAMAKICAQDEFAQQIQAAFELRKLETDTAPAGRKSANGRRL